jgi:succinyl-diaminopimelate desuccinylase
MPRASYLVVAEPTDLRPRVGHRGAFWVDLHARGRSCHASTPELGENAITKLVQDLGWLTDLVGSEVPADARLGPPTINVGTIRGGAQRNIVPDRAVAEVDIRLAGRDGLARLEQAVADGLPHGSEVEVRVSLPGVATDPGHPLMVRAAAIAADDGAGAARFFTDASVLTPALGDVPTVIWGPGSPDQAHVVDEHCPVEQIDRAVQHYLQLLHGDLPTK